MTITFPYDKLHDCLCVTMRYVLSMMPSMKHSYAKRLLSRRLGSLPAIDDGTPPPVGMQSDAIFGYDEVDIGDGDSITESTSASATAGQGSPTKPSACLPPLAEALDRLHRLSPLANCSLRQCRVGVLDTNGEPIDYSGAALNIGMQSPGFLSDQFIDPFSPVYASAAGGAPGAEKSSITRYTFDECAPRVDLSGHMNSEATRRLSFATWPHMNYKYDCKTVLSTASDSF